MGMAKDLIIANRYGALVPAEDGGWLDESRGGDNVIVGQLLRFLDWKLFARTGYSDPVEDGTRFLVIETRAAWVHWSDDSRPDKYVFREPGGELPDRNRLGDDDEDEWPVDPRGAPKDPWANTRFVYLADPETGELFTFTTSSIGGRRCVADLAKEIVRYRAEHPGALPIVELSSTGMQTRYGQKSRPVLNIVDWRIPNGRKGER
jgi:hypothetical protein